MIRTLLVGFGGMGRTHHLPVLRACRQIQLVGIVRTGRSANENGLPVFHSVEQAIQKTQPALAIISTPHNLHYDQARQCLEHNCHVFVEKPLALEYQQCEELGQLAAKKDRLLVVGLQRRYEGFANIYRELVRKDRLGRIQLVHGLFAHRFSGAECHGWRADPDQAGFGIIHDSALHLLDLLLCVARGRVRELISSSILFGKDRMPHSFACLFDIDNGVSVSACGSYLAPVNSVQEEISVYGTKGALFARRFCKEWNTDPPMVFFKSTDGSSQHSFDLSTLPRGRTLPLEVMLRVLNGETPRDTLLTEATQVLETHRLAELLRKYGQSQCD